MTLDRLIEDSLQAAKDGDARGALVDVLARTVADAAAVLRAIGEPDGPRLQVLHRCAELTILNVVWAPHMSFVPHDHRTWAAIGLYAGREDNIFWRRSRRGIEACGAKALFAGDATALDEDVIHSVTNPLPRLSCAIHVYGGDFLGMQRTQWNAETLAEEPNDSSISSAAFAAANVTSRRR